MEYIHVSDAAKQAGTSEKTIRRAVESGKLMAQARVFKNKPLMISLESLNNYTASRQRVQTRLEPEHSEQRLEALEQRIQQLEEQNIEKQKCIEDLEQHLNWTRDFVLKLQEELTNLRAAKTAVPDQPPAQKAKPVAKTKVSAKDATIFTLADFSIGWKDCYKSTAVHGDVHAWIDLVPCSQGTQGQYMISGFADKIKPRGSISEAQKARSDALYEMLKQQMLEAMQAVGWKEDGKLGTRQLYRKVK